MRTAPTAASRVLAAPGRRAAMESPGSRIRAQADSKELRKLSQPPLGWPPPLPALPPAGRPLTAGRTAVCKCPKGRRSGFGGRHLLRGSTLAAACEAGGLPPVQSSRGPDQNPAAAQKLPPDRKSTRL